MTKILIVDDSVPFCLMLQGLLKKNGYAVTITFSSRKAKQIIEETYFDLVLSDIRMPDFSGMDLIPLIKKRQPKTQIIMMTSYAEITTAIESIKQGAFNYISKPINPDNILSIIKEAIISSKTKNLVKPDEFLNIESHMTGNCTLAIQLKNHIELVAPTNMSVLIIGESGTGKENIARLIHKNSQRAKFPFVAVDCGALAKGLASSDFFGHVKGSFTGAVLDRIGHFEAANNGTLFLDEVGNLSYETQMQLLRALQERSIKPIGGNKEIPVDIRIIAATNEDLIEAQFKNTFREDLFYRLNEFQIKVPPLRKRQTDIMLFAHFFLTQSNLYLKKSVEGFEKNIEIIFQNYPWPGNLREMKNVIKRATLLARGKLISIKEIPPEMYLNNPSHTQFSLTNETNEYELIKKALKVSNYNKTMAARILNIDRKTLYNKLKSYEISFSNKNQ